MAEVFHKFRPTVYYLTFLSVHFFACAFVLVNSRKGRKVRSSRTFKLYMKALWSVLEAFLKQWHLKPIASSGRVLWCLLSLGIFVLVFGYLLNLISTDQVATRKTPELHSLKDLDSSYFKHMQPRMSPVLYLYSVAKEAAPESTLGRFYKRIIQNKEAGVIRNNVTGMDAIDGVISENKNLVITQIAYDYILRPIGCILKPATIKSSYRSRESFASGVLATFYSTKLDLELEKYFQYKVRTLFESRRSTKMLQKVVLAFTEQIGQKKSFDAIICEDGLERSAVEVHLISLSLSSLEKLFFFRSYAFLVACFLLILEISFCHTKKVLQSKCSRRRQKKQFLGRIVAWRS